MFSSSAKLSHKSWRTLGIPVCNLSLDFHAFLWVQVTSKQHEMTACGEPYLLLLPGSCWKPVIGQRKSMLISWTDEWWAGSLTTNERFAFGLSQIFTSEGHSKLINPFPVWSGRTASSKSEGTGDSLSYCHGHQQWRPFTETISWGTKCQKLYVDLFLIYAEWVMMLFGSLGTICTVSHPRCERKHSPSIYSSNKYLTRNHSGISLG